MESRGFLRWNGVGRVAHLQLPTTASVKLRSSLRGAPEVPAPSL